MREDYMMLLIKWEGLRHAVRISWVQWWEWLEDALLQHSLTQVILGDTGDIYLREGKALLTLVHLVVTTSLYRKQSLTGTTQTLPSCSSVQAIQQEYRTVDRRSWADTDNGTAGRETCKAVGPTHFSAMSNRVPEEKSCLRNSREQRYFTACTTYQTKR